MKVENILSTKGSRVFVVGVEASISEAVDVLSSRNIGAVIVKDAKGAVAGILSERDVVRQINSRGVAVLAEKVSSCMTPNPYTCTLETSLDDLMSMMTRKRIRHMPVVERNQLKGLVSIGDVVKRKIEQSEREAAALKEYIAS